MSLCNKLTLYKDCIKPTMSYASPGVGSHNNMRNFKKLQVVQNHSRSRTASYVIKEASQPLFKAAATHSNLLIVAAFTHNPAFSIKTVLFDPDDQITKSLKTQGEGGWSPNNATHSPTLVHYTIRSSNDNIRELPKGQTSRPAIYSRNIISPWHYRHRLVVLLG